MKLLHSVDDTKLLEKMIVKEIKTNFDDIINSKNGLNLITSLFVANHTMLKTYEGDVTVT